MVFKPRNGHRYIVFPQFTLNSCKLNYVSQFRYLGHILNNCLTDDDDIYREIKNLFVRTNVLIRRFYRCSKKVWKKAGFIQMFLLVYV